jgi:hypothetical protein
VCFIIDSDADGGHPVFSLSYFCKRAIFFCLTKLLRRKRRLRQVYHTRFRGASPFFGEFRPSVPIFVLWVSEPSTALKNRAEGKWVRFLFRRQIEANGIKGSGKVQIRQIGGFVGQEQSILT